MDKDLFDKLSEAEKAVVLKGLKGKPILETYHHDFGSKHVRFGYISDTHIGHKCFSLELWDKMAKHFKAKKVEVVYHAGDILEGMSGRDGHIYELDAIGAEAQMSYASDLLNSVDFKVYGILGNHDLWYSAKANIGLNIGKELEFRCKNFINLGDWEANVDIGKGVLLKLYHGNDGSAYATSYKLQKLIESFTGGEKPNIVLSGHYHKSLYMFVRNVHGFESGTLCGQTRWMRGKKIAAHMGFGLVDVWISKNGVQRLVHEFVPHYET